LLVHCTLLYSTGDRTLANVVGAPDDGESVRENIGWVVVEAAVGLSVGTVGVAVGADIVALVGKNVGWVEGATVVGVPATPVGETVVGAAVGAAVGDAVGENVGASIHSQIAAVFVVYWLRAPLAEHCEAGVLQPPPHVKGVHAASLIIGAPPALRLWQYVVHEYEDWATNLESWWVSSVWA
jgi:hypothetical protein